MRNSTILRASLLATVFGAALSAHAFVFQTTGTIDDSGLLTSTTYEFSDLAPFGTTFICGASITGSGVLDATYTQGATSLSLTTDPGTNHADFKNNTYSFSGKWTMTGGTNLGLAPGTEYAGTYASYFDFTGHTTGLFVTGNVQPVPEPSAVAALGLGAVGLLRRRKRA